MSAGPDRVLAGERVSASERAASNGLRGRGTHMSGNTYDKYATTNPLEQRMMAGFMTALDRILDGLAPTRILEIGVGEGQVMTRVRHRFPGVPVVGLDLPDDELAGRWRDEALPCCFGDATRLPFE